MKLYTQSHSPFTARVRMACYAKSLTITMAEPPDGPGSEAFKKISPLGLIPVLELDDDTASATVIPESEVILEYLEDQFPDPPLRPKDLILRSRARLLAHFCDQYLHGPLKEIVYQAKADVSDQDVVQAHLPSLYAALDYVEHYIGGSGYAAGDQLSFADCALVPLLFFVDLAWSRLGLSDVYLDRPKLKAYWREIGQNPHAARVLAEMAEAQGLSV